ncbi:MAG: hypothetical protein U0V75_14805 [Ferruginibacter sp.]
MQIITIYDFLLLPVYLFIFYLLIKKRAAALETDELKKIFYTAFFLRMLGSVAYSMLVQYYYGYGDSFTYYKGSSFINEQLLKNLDNIKYLFTSSAEFQQWFNTEEGDMYLSGYTAISSNNMVMKIAGIISFLAFNKFMIISLFFGLFSFAGQWKLFEVFNDYNHGKFQKLMALAVLFTPSIWFWGSGLMKDSLCIGAAGFIISTLYNSIKKKQISIREWILLPFLVLMLYTVKNYILVIIMAGLALTFFVRYTFRIKNMLVRAAVIFAFVISFSGVLYFADFSSVINNVVEESYMQIQSFSQNYQNLQSEDERSKAGVQIENIDASLSGIIAKSPEAVFTCLYRPFLWESKKLIILFTSLESTLLLLATLYLLLKSRFVGFFRICFSNSLIFFSLITSLFFALVIGFTTFNFGTMIRYKIILLPFYYFMLVAVFTKLSEAVAQKEVAPAETNP